MLDLKPKGDSVTLDLPLRKIWLSSDEIETSRLRRQIAKYMGWFLAVVTLVAYLARVAAGPVPSVSHYLVIFFVGAYAAVPLQLQATGRLRMAVATLLTLMLGELAAFAYLGGGLYAPSLVFLSVVPVAAIFLAGIRVGLLTTGLALAIVIVLGFAPELGWPVPELLISGAGERFARGSLLALACTAAATLAWFLERQLAELRARLHSAAASDPLTGLANRTRVEEGLIIEWHRLSRQQHGCLSVILFDIDHFKSFNDTYGHPAGDEVLKIVASVATQRVRRAGEFVARHGGEEFLVVLPGVSTEEAGKIAELLRTDIVKLGITHTGSPVGLLTISFGVATVHCPDPLPIATLMDTADAALYRAKGEGRNRVVVHGV